MRIPLRRWRAIVAVLISALFLSAMPSAAVAAPPAGVEFSELNVTPDPVDVSQGHVTVTVTVRVKNAYKLDGDGLEFQAKHPSGQVIYPYGTSAMHRARGSVVDGIWQTEIGVSASDLTDGTWKASVYSQRATWFNDLSDPYITGEFSVVGGLITDVTPPLMTEHSLSTSSLVIESDPVVATVRVNASDASGMPAPRLRVHRTDGKGTPHAENDVTFDEAMDFVDGSETDGTWQADIVFWPRSRSGTWSVDIVSRDYLGNASPEAINLGTIEIDNKGDIPPSEPVIIGEPRVGNTLTVDDDAWTGTDYALEYVWHVDDRAYHDPKYFHVRPEHLGKSVHVEVTAHKSGHTPETVSTESVEIKSGILPDAVLTLEGVPELGETLYVDRSGWGWETDVTYQWLADGAPIEGATDDTLVLTEAQVGKVIAVTISGTQDGYEQSTETSAETAPVAGAEPLDPEPTPGPETPTPEPTPGTSTPSQPGTGTPSPELTPGTGAPTQPGTEQPITEPTPIVFKDNPAKSGFYAPIQWMAAEGISVGYADGTFNKNKNVTRGETAQFMYKMTGSAHTATGNPFVDVRAAFKNAIGWFSDEEISVGYKDGTFRPGQAVTRAEFAAFLYRLEDPSGYKAPSKSPFSDINVDGANWKAISWLSQSGITSGYGDDSFKPSKNITRAETAAFLNRYAALSD